MKFTTGITGKTKTSRRYTPLSGAVRNG